MGAVQNIHDVMRLGAWSAHRDLDFKPRRGKPRLRAGVPAVLITMNGRQVVSLLDLSESGAGLVVKDGWRLNGGVLKWMDYEESGSSTSLVDWLPEYIGSKIFERQHARVLSVSVSLKLAEPSIAQEQNEP